MEEGMEDEISVQASIIRFMCIGIAGGSLRMQ